MVNSLGRLELDAGANAEAQTGPPSPAVLRELHRDLVRDRRQTFLKGTPLVLLAVFIWVVGIAAPKEFGGLVFLAFVILMGVGGVGVDWLRLRRADPIVLYEQQLRQAELRKEQQLDHILRSASVVPIASIAVTAGIVIVSGVQLLWIPLGKAIVAAGLVKPAVRAGEWWRLLTATYLHGSLVHLTSNAGAAFAIGRVMEIYDRRLRVPAVYLAAAVAGSLVSTAVSSRPSIGASGGVLGLMAYVLVVAGRQPGGTPAWIRREMVSMLAATALMGIVAFRYIDNAAHLGGAAMGAAIGYLATTHRDPSPDLLNIAGAVAAAILGAGAVFTLVRLL